MKEAFVIGDIHGEIHQLNEVLKYWNKDTQQLILLGDLIDRGVNSLEVIRLAMDLVKEHEAIVLSGNHEEMLLDWLKNPELQANFYYKHGGIQTINSFFGYSITSLEEPKKIAKMIVEEFGEEINFLKSRPLYFEYEKYVFVHAGVDLSLPDWKKSTSEDYLWIRTPFHVDENTTDKIFVFGHTPTKGLNENHSNMPWISPCKSKIGIDGGAVFNGYLHGLHIDLKTDQYDFVSISKDLTVLQSYLNLHKIA